jgi:DNA replication protein DnaC
MKEHLKNNKIESGHYCSYCDYRGIIIVHHYRELGEEPLSPCPRCILSKCNCNGKEPYFFFENGEIRECYCRHTRLNIKKIKAIYNRSGIDKKYQWRFINDFESVNKLAAKARAIAYDIIMKFPDVKKGLFLWGNPGTGKTLLSAIILTELITRYAVEGRFIKISRTFFNRLRATFVEGSPSYGTAEKIEHELSDVDVLIVDDFGIQRDSAWEQETLYNLIDARYEGEKFTIFTSNNSPLKTLKDISDGRVLSRIQEMCRIIEISGSDYREKL